MLALAAGAEGGGTGAAGDETAFRGPASITNDVAVFEPVALSLGSAFDKAECLFSYNSNAPGFDGQSLKVTRCMRLGQSSRFQ